MRSRNQDENHQINSPPAKPKHADSSETVLQAKKLSVYYGKTLALQEVFNGYPEKQRHCLNWPFWLR